MAVIWSVHGFLLVLIMLPYTVKEQDLGAEMVESLTQGYFENASLLYVCGIRVGVWGYDTCCCRGVMHAIFILMQQIQMFI